MSRFYIDFVPPAPPPDNISKWASGLNLFVNKDWEAAQRNRNPVQSLSWNPHDQDLQSIVGQYNDFLSNTPGYQSLDWRLVDSVQ